MRCITPRRSIALAGLLAIAVVTVGSRPATAQYVQTNLVSDLPGLAQFTDPNLVNPWGMSFSATSPFWISDAGHGTATLYSITGSPQALVVAIPPATTGAGRPSGQVFNTGGSTDFMVTNPATGASAKSVFIFAGLDGTISGWSPALNAGVPAVQNQAFLGVNNHAAGAVYTGLATGNDGARNLLYAANTSLRRIDVFDGTFSPTTLAGDFSDPNGTTGFSPFNVQALGGHLFVAYKGSGFTGGFVDEFTMDGTFVRRFSGGSINSPWGMTLAPPDFGPFSNALLIGDFNGGNSANTAGLINAFDPNTGSFLGLLTNPSGGDIALDGLWSLDFRTTGTPGDLFFSAGIQGQRHGLFGTLAATPEPGSWTLLGACALPLLGLLRRRRRR